MIDFVNGLMKEIELRVLEVEAMEANSLKKSLEAFHVLGEAFDRLKAFVINYEFKDDAQEIHFFKVIKPSICSHLIYYRKVYNIEMNRPVGNLEAQRVYLCKQLDKIQDFTEKRLDFYRYMRSGNTMMDACYFKRGNEDMELYLESFTYERDPKFSTNYDFKAAQILANDMLVIFLKKELELLESNNLIPIDKTFPKVKHTWTGNKTDLVEQLYAWDTEGCFDNGNLSLTQMTAYIENVFNIDLGQNISRSFSEMRTRNTPTPFLDRLKAGIIKRMRRKE